MNWLATCHGIWFTPAHMLDYLLKKLRPNETLHLSASEWERFPGHVAGASHLPKHAQVKWFADFHGLHHRFDGFTHALTLTHNPTIPHEKPQRTHSQLHSQPAPRPRCPIIEATRRVMR